jgi:hypothetical protein
MFMQTIMIKHSRPGIILSIAIWLTVAHAICLADPTIVAVAVASSPGFTLNDLKAQVPHSKEGNLMLDIPQILSTVKDKGVQAVLAGQTIETTGQVMLETVDNNEGKRLRVARSQILCCAVHARQYSVLVEFSGKAPVFNEISWVKLVGTISYKQEGSKTVPVISAKVIEETAKPDSPLLR